MSRRRWWADAKVVGVLALAAATFGFSGWVLVRNPAPVQATPSASAGSAAGVATPVPQPVAAFLGDSYTEAPELPARAGYAWLVADKMDWQPIVKGYSGAGYLTKNTKGITIPAELPAILDAKPDILVLAAGRNDLGVDDDALEKVAGSVIVQAQEASPAMRIIVVGPWPGSGHPSSMFLSGRDALASAAAKHSVTFVDPIAGGWITGDHARGTGNAVQYIADDGVHATAAGHAHIADKMVEALRADGF